VVQGDREEYRGAERRKGRPSAPAPPPPGRHDLAPVSSNVSGANEFWEPSGEPTWSDTRRRQATDSHGHGWWMRRSEVRTNDLDGRRSVEPPADGHYSHGMWLSAEQRPSLIRYERGRG